MRMSAMLVVYPKRSFEREKTQISIELTALSIGSSLTPHSHSALSMVHELHGASTTPGREVKGFSGMDGDFGSTGRGGCLTPANHGALTGSSYS